jgi:hypothetical protein
MQKSLPHDEKLYPPTAEVAANAASVVSPRRPRSEQGQIVDRTFRTSPMHAEIRSRFDRCISAAGDTVLRSRERPDPLQPGDRVIADEAVTAEPRQ